MHKWLLSEKGNQKMKIKKIRQNNLTLRDNQKEQNYHFDIDIEWLKEKFMTRESDFF